MSRFFDDNFPRPFGVFYQEDRPCYEEQLIAQINHAKEIQGETDLDDLLRGKRSWTVD